VTGDLRSRLRDDARQRRVHGVLSAGGPATPAALRARVAAQARPAPAPALQPRRRVALAGAVGAVALAAVLVLTLVAELGTHPTIAEASRPSGLAATAPAPTRDPARPALLRAAFAGVTFPEWDRDFGWRTTGRRRDALDGRTAETVFYQHTHHRIGYTVLSGKPLKPPDDADRYVVNGLELRAYSDGPRDVVTFERAGRTCVLAGEVHSRSTLLKLASWRGDGAIAF
jgi:hypothetical protein